jgi:uncharacterized membrane protein
MSGLCKYKDIFGIPKTGAHKYRLFNIAVVDVIATIIVGLIISYIFHLNIWLILIILFLLGIIIHRLFCVKTTVDITLFGK